MDIGKLHTFSTLCTCRNFTETAEQLYVSQPNVSKQIKRLETELGVHLIERQGRTFRITEAGELFLEYANQILKLYAEAQDRLKPFALPTQQFLNFGTTSLIGANILPEVLSGFMQQIPHAQIAMKIESSKQIVRMLMQQEIEFAFLSSYIPLPSDEYCSQFFCEDKLVLIVPPTHRLAEHTTCTLADLNGEYFLIKNANASLYKHLLKSLNHPSFMLDKRIEVGSQTSIKHSVQHGLGISIVSEHIVTSDIERGELVALSIDGFDLKRDIHIVYPKTHPLSSITEEFIKFLQRYPY
ncbi:LysR family transcriptional regulator [Aerococcaceae bacterium NML210727]|nr:LysR family transcriptional regulator [Aerococcaceae bacterium NML210727]MCW6655038.1 LysR family transcriptional regulator [Aerococcaceae bacterium NML201296]